MKKHTGPARSLRSLRAARSPRGRGRAFRRWLLLLLRTMEERPRAWAASAAALIYLPLLTASPIRGALEANRLQAAREMLASGDAVIPTLNGVPYLAKPPLFCWMIAALSAPMGGVSLWSGRLVAALSVVGLAALVAGWCARELGRRAAVPAAFALLASGVLLDKGTLAELEAPLALATAAALFAFHGALRAGGRAWPRLLAAGLCLGAAILIKGPVAPLFLAVVAGGLALAGPRRARTLGFAAAALALGALVAAPWALLVLERIGFGGVRDVLHREVGRRLVAAGGTNREPFWYYAYALPAALGPAALLLPAAWHGARVLRRRDRAAFAFLAAWGAGSLIALSCSSGKEVRYVMPALPAWAAAIGLGLVQRDAGPRLRRYHRALAGALCALLPRAPILLAAAGWILFPTQRPAVLLGAALLLAGALAVGPSGRLRSRAGAVAALGLLVLGLRVFFSAGYLRDLSGRLPLAEVSAAAARHLAREEPLIYAGCYASDVHFALARPIVLVGDEQALEHALGEPPPASGAHVVLTNSLELAQPPAAGWTRLGSWSKGRRRLELFLCP